MFKRARSWVSKRFRGLRFPEIPEEFRRNTLPSCTENARSLKSVKENYGVDIVQLIQGLEKRKARVLDSGAGLMKVSIGLKERFGNKFLLNL